MQSVKLKPLAAALSTMIAMMPAHAIAQYNPKGNFDAMSNERNGQSKTIDNAIQILPDRDTPQQFNAYSIMIDYGRCAAKIATPKLQGAMTEKASSAGERRLWADAAALSQSCKGSIFRPTYSLMRGSYAEGLYHASLVSAPSYGPLQPTDPGYVNFLAREKEHNTDLEVNDQVMSNATNCMVAMQPSVTDAVLSTKHGSAEEAKAMDVLFTTAPVCSGPKRQHKLSRSYLRAFIANTAYRYAMFRAPKLVGIAK